MRRQPSRAVEVESRDAFDALVAAGATSMSGWAVQAVDLRDRGAALRRLDARGALFLGFRLDEEAETDLRERGALVFPTLPHLPFETYCSRLYTPEELYDGLGTSYPEAPDARIYAWSREARPGLAHHLAQGLHDLAVDHVLPVLSLPPRSQPVG